MQTFFADEVVSPHPRGGVERLKCALIHVRGGKIRGIESLSKTSFSKRTKRVKRLRIVIPGLIDPHTHLVFAGDRSAEWSLKLKGVSYQEIAQAGGGIQSTVKATRAADEGLLLRLARERLQRSLKLGVTTIEIKSGYGLSLDSELKILRLIQKLKKTSAQSIVATAMPAHSLPREFKSHSDYVDWIIREAIPKFKGLAEFQDVFCEKGYFDVRDSIRLLQAGKRFGMRPKVHAHEFGRTGGVEVAAKVRATSADHLMYLNAKDMQLLRGAGVIPVLLPGTTFFLREPQYAPARKMMSAGLCVALGSDFNPGTCPTLNFPLIGSIAAIQLGMSLDEIFVAQTYHSALALGFRDRGIVRPGLKADFVELDAAGFEALYYSYGNPPISRVFVNGQEV